MGLCMSCGPGRRRRGVVVVAPRPVAVVRRPIAVVGRPVAVIRRPPVAVARGRPVRVGPAMGGGRRRL